MPTSQTLLAPVVSPPGECPGTMCFIPPERLRTSYEYLRPGAAQAVSTELAPMPLRVAPTKDGYYEVIDGFKRLRDWLEQAPDLIPVVVEQPGRPEDDKRRLFLANGATRTLTALDHARVVDSLKKDDGCSPGATARLLGRKPHWVKSRLRLAARLSKVAAQKLAQRAIGPTLAQKLCELAGKEQDAVLSCIERHALKVGEAVRLVGAYLAADNEERQALLRTPHDVVRPEPPPPTISPSAALLEQRVNGYRRAFGKFRTFTIPDDFAPAEERRLQACYRGAVDELEKTACAVLGAHLRTHMEELHVQDQRQKRDAGLPDAAPRPAANIQTKGGAGRRSGRNPEPPPVRLWDS
jgi:ParB-like chromosome segregation protein Spo0J